MTFEEYMKRSQALSEELDKIPGYRDWSNNAKASRRNEIAHAVNCRVSAAEIGLKDKFEKAWYNYLWKSAELHNKRYGFWPVFEMEEIESDDPKTDIYHD